MPFDACMYTIAGSFWSPACVERRVDIFIPSLGAYPGGRKGLSGKNTRPSLQLDATVDAEESAERHPCAVNSATTKMVNCCCSRRLLMRDLRNKRSRHRLWQR